MKKRTAKRRAGWLPALRVSLLYAVFGGAWILFSDGILLGSAPSKEAMLFISTVKGWLYVAVTSLLLFLLVRGELRRRARLEGDIEAELAEKELLLREVNHRVRNNLQVMLSSMRLQEGSASADALADARMRIQMLGLVHDLAYERGDSRHVDLGALAAGLADSIRAELAPARPVAVEAEPVAAGIDAASPLGFALVEALVNAFRHGAGEVRVTVRDAGAVAVIEVADRGPGFPAGDFERSGFGILRALAGQAGATVEARNEGGAVLRFRLARG